MTSKTSKQHTHKQTYKQVKRLPDFIGADAARIIYGRFRGAFLGRQAQHALRVGCCSHLWMRANDFLTQCKVLSGFESAFNPKWAFFMGSFRGIVGGFWQNSFAAARRRERLGSAAALLEWTPSLGLSYAKNVRDLRTMA